MSHPLFTPWLIPGVAALAALGPRPRKPDLRLNLPSVPRNPADACAWLAAKEARFAVRPDNQARILWAAKFGEATPLVFVYLHGYTATWREGAPVHLDTARRYGANLLLTRLAGHGLVTEEPLLDVQAEEWWADAQEALALAGSLGAKVVLMATSSGAPLALRLAALAPERVHALVLYSANIRIRQPGSRLMSWPWGLYVARLVKGGRYNTWDEGPEAARYWYDRSRLEGAVQLQALLDVSTRAQDFKPVRQPLYAAAYYRDARRRDPTVEVWAQRWMFGQVSTPTQAKRFQEFPDATHHILPCDWMNRDWRSVRQGTWDFLEQVVGLKPAVSA